MQNNAALASDATRIYTSCIMQPEPDGNIRGIYQVLLAVSMKKGRMLQFKGEQGLIFSPRQTRKWILPIIIRLKVLVFRARCITMANIMFEPERQA